MSFTAILPSTTTTTYVTTLAESAPWAESDGRTAALPLGPEQLGGSSRVRSAATSLKSQPQAAGVCGKWWRHQEGAFFQQAANFELEQD
eukprot:scaffold21780_cov18-Phaeocystis_antarctica.AAC.1